MRKIAIILGVFVLIAGVYGQVTQQIAETNKNIEDTFTTIKDTDLVDVQILNKSQLFEKQENNEGFVNEKLGLLNEYSGLLTLLIAFLTLCIAYLSYKTSSKAYSISKFKLEKEMYDDYVKNRIEFKKKIFPQLNSLIIKKLDDIVFVNFQNEISKLKQINDVLDSNVGVLTKIFIYHPQIEQIKCSVNELIELLNNTTEDDLNFNCTIADWFKKADNFTTIATKYFYLYWLFYSFRPLNTPALFTKIDKTGEIGKKYNDNDFDVFYAYYNNFISSNISQRLDVLGRE